MFSSSVTALLVWLWISFAIALCRNAKVLSDIRFYQELNFTGRLPYGQRWNSKDCFNLDLDFYDMTTAPRVSSLITSDCLMVYDMENCEGIPLRESNHIRIPPGEYPNLVEFLQKNYFPCTVMSFRACSKQEAGLSKPSVHLKADSRQIYYEIDHMRNICGCTDLQVHAIGRVGSLESGNCITLFSEPNCQGKSVNIPGGSTVASRNLRVVNFKNIAKSLDLCDGSEPPACDGVSVNIPKNNGNRAPPPPNYLDETEVVEEGEILENFNLNEMMARCENKNTENVSCSTTCGGTLYTDRGAILYKLTESLESFERCVWIVRTPSHRSKFEVDLTWSGFKPVGHKEILVSSYLPSRWYYGYGHGLKTQRLHMSTYPKQLVGALLIITLYTNELPISKEEKSRGFILEYNSVEDGPEFPMSLFSSDHIIKIGQKIEYPRDSEVAGNLRVNERETYSENELSTFLFLPNDKENLKTGSKNYFVEVAWVESLPDEILESKRKYQQEYVASYNFRNGEWVTTAEESIGESPKTFVNDDMILLLFHPLTNGTKGEQFYFKSGAQDKNICPWNLSLQRKKK